MSQYLFISSAFDHKRMAESIKKDNFETYVITSIGVILGILPLRSSKPMMLKSLRNISYHQCIYVTPSW
jgi:hypothetical protein